MSATQRTLNDIANSEEFSDAETFKSILAQIEKTKEIEDKMGLYFTLVDVQEADEIAHFLGARDSELRKYAQVLEQKAELSSEQANIVVQKLIQSLKGGLN